VRYSAEIFVLPLEDGCLGPRSRLTSFECFDLRLSARSFKNDALDSAKITYHDEPHLCDTAKKTVIWSGPLTTPPVAHIRHQLPPGDADRPTRRNPKALVGDEYAKPYTFVVSLSALFAFTTKAGYCVNFLRDHLWSMKAHFAAGLCCLHLRLDRMHSLSQLTTERLHESNVTSTDRRIVALTVVPSMSC